MIKLKNNLFYIFLAFISIITASNAQTYMKTNIPYNGIPLYDITESVIYMNYNPPQPKCNGWEGSNFYQRRLWVTTNETETNPSLTTKINNSGMKLHIYHPKVNANRNASESPLPVIVFGYGGGFLNPYTVLNSGFSASADTAIQKWFAERGFIVVAPEYRIGINLFDAELSQRAVWRAVQDIRKVIRKSKNLNTTDYSVDRFKPVTYVGYSSGAFIGLHNLYLNESNRTESTRAGFEVESNIWYREYMRLPFMTYDLGTLDEPLGGATTDTDMSNQTVQDITVAISGAIGDINWISTNTNPKPKALYLIHHPEDGVVPYNSGFAYMNFELFNSKKFKYPVVFGSNFINNMYQADSSVKPKLYKYTTVKANCFGVNNCIEGNAGTAVGPLRMKTWYHYPTEDKAKNLPLMDSILEFIKASIYNILNPNNPVALKGTIVDGNKEEAKELATTSVDIYPNPVTGDIMNITAIEDGTPYFIYNALGQVVGSGKLENGTIAVAKLSQGTYILKVITKDQDVVKQFIKQ